MSESYYERNKEVIKERSRKRYYLNREEAIKRSSERNKLKREEHNAAAARWRANNPEKHAEYQQRYRAVRSGALVGRACTLDELISFYGNYCMVPECSNTDLTVDHVIPLSLGGPHEAANLQLLCRSHNSSKGNRASTDYRPFKVVILSV